MADIVYPKYSSIGSNKVQLLYAYSAIMEMMNTGSMLVEMAPGSSWSSVQNAKRLARENGFNVRAVSIGGRRHLARVSDE